MNDAMANEFSSSTRDTSATDPAFDFCFRFGKSRLRRSRSRFYDADAASVMAGSESAFRGSRDVAASAQKEKQ
jgi:hypothetical protein